jgi:hypothetical protein
MSDGGRDGFWSSLQRTEHRFEAEATETERKLYRTVYGYKSRVMRLRSALAKSGPIAFQTVTSKLEGIKLDAIWGILFSAVRDMALYYGGSVVLGTAIGAGLGSLAFGVGAIPGAAIGAEAGNVVGEWVLMYLGLKMLAEGLVNTIPPALRLYVQGFRIAWGPTEKDRPDARYSADYHHGEDMAAHRFADGHVLMIMAILIAIVAYLTRGKSEEALMQAVRKSERLGVKMADWLADNKERLLKEERLRPKAQMRAPSQDSADESSSNASRGSPRPKSSAPETPPKPTVMSPAETARSWQGSGSYPGVDAWSDTKLAKGTYVVGAAPGQSEFYTTLDGFNATDGTAEDYYQNLQIGPNTTNPNYPPYRSGVTIYQVNTDNVPAAMGNALANPQFGPGGAPQLFIPGYKDALTPVYSIPFK